MPAPSNTSFATATDLGVVTTAATSGTQNVRDGGVNYVVYYKFTTPAAPTLPQIAVVSVFGVGAVGSTSDSSLYQVITSIYKGPAGAPTALVPTTTARNFVIQFPVEGSTEYFIKFDHAWGNTPNPADLSYRIQLGPSSAYTVGDLVVNDDSAGRPAAIRSRSTGEVLRFVDLVAGEPGVVLPSGIMGLGETGGGFYVYDGTFALITSISLATLGDDPYRVARSELGNFFVFVNGQSSSRRPKIYKVDSGGTIVSIWTITTTYVLTGPCGVSPDETIAYYGQGSVSLPKAIKRWDLITDTASTDLSGTTTASGYAYGFDILVLTDGSLLVPYQNASTADYKIRHYADDGTLLNEFDYPDLIDRLAYTENHPDEFLAWFQPITPDPPQPGLDHFDTILVSDGSILDSVPGRQYETGVYQASEQTATPDEYFGHSFSCPVLVLLGTTTIDTGGFGEIGPLAWVHFPRRVPSIS